MIFDAGKWTYRNILLQACDAARWFVPHRSSPGRRRFGWKPLVLRWRKQARHRAAGVVHRTVRSITKLSFPQIHFHFSSFYGGKHVSKSASISTIFDRKISRTYIFANARADAAHAMHYLPKGRPSPASRALSSHGSKTGRSSSEPPLPRNRRDANLPPLGLALRRPLDAESRRRNRTGMRRDGPVLFDPATRGATTKSASISRGDDPGTDFATVLSPRKPRGLELRQIRRSPWLIGSTHTNALQTKTKRIASPLARRQRTESPDDQPPKADGPIRVSPFLINPGRPRQLKAETNRIAVASRQPRRATQAAAMRPDDPVRVAPSRIRISDELVWRRAEHKVTEVVERVRQLETLYSREGSNDHPSAARQATFQPPAPAEPAIVRSITQLDPSLVDRLTDDVIRKVDQRIRIERERRGL